MFKKFTILLKEINIVALTCYATLNFSMVNMLKHCLRALIPFNILIHILIVSLQDTFYISLGRH